MASVAMILLFSVVKRFNVVLSETTQEQTDASQETFTITEIPFSWTLRAELSSLRCSLGCEILKGWWSWAGVLDR